ncbi:hypothetical protein ACOMHN_042588 [Nucella lapillus]
MADPSKKKKTLSGSTTPMRKPDNFEELEKEFETVLNELLADENLEQFKKEYEKLHTALVNSHDSERQLMEKVRELNNEITANAEKVATALKLSLEDESRITSLTEELEGAWKKVEYLKQREQTSKETVTALHAEIENLNLLVQRGADLALQFHLSEPSGFKYDPSDPSDPSEGGKGKDGLSPGELASNEKESMKKNLTDMESEKSKLEEMINNTLNDVRKKTMELQRERNRRMNAETEVRDKTKQIEDQTVVISDVSRQLDTVRQLVSQQELNIRELRVNCELGNKELEMITGRLQKTQLEMEKQSSVVEALQMNTQLEMEKQSNVVEALQMEVSEQVQALRMKDDKMNRLNDQVKKLTKAKDSANRKLKILTEQRSILRREKEQLVGQLASAEKTIENNKRAKELDEKYISGLMHERDILNKNFVKQVKATEKQTNLVSLHEQTNRNMGHEIMGFRRESEKQRRIIQQLERERDRYINENGDLTVKMMKTNEECQVRDLQILDLKKRGEELESRLKIQQNLYEAVHQDRNMYSRQLIESQDEMNEMKNKLRVLEHQSHQLKEEVAAREAAVVKEHLECLRLEKERDALQAEIQMLKKQLRDVEQVIRDLRAEEKNLQKVITDSDEMIKRQKRELDTLISERDILGSQLVRRNDELSLLYQKVQLLQILINNGNKIYDQRLEKVQIIMNNGDMIRMYDQRLEDIRLLRLEVRRQRHENLCLQKSVANVRSYKQELYSVHREVLHERARCAALENELSHPRQIHRWRGLEVTDPSKFELLQKVQALQKRLISRTEEVVEVEQVLQEKDRLYLELRALLERQPGPEVATQISTYQRVRTYTCS